MKNCPYRASDIKIKTFWQDSEDEKKRDAFVQNPALLRKQADERRQSHVMRGQGRRYGQGHQAPSQEAPKYEVKGKAKGQGQEADVLKNRRFKEKNKSSRGNHNRRYMADKKRMGFGGGPWWWGSGCTVRVNAECFPLKKY